MTEHVFVALFAGAKDSKLHLILTHFIHDAVNKVKAFLVGQTGNDADQHDLRIDIQPQVFLESQLVFDFFFPECPGRIGSREIGVRLRIKSFVIDPVDDAPQIMGAGA